MTVLRAICAWVGLLARVALFALFALVALKACLGSDSNDCARAAEEFGDVPPECYTQNDEEP